MAHPVFFDQNGRRARIVNITMMMLVFGADQPQRPNFHRVRGSVAAAASDPLSQGLLGTKFDYE
jgi:hypothetical protein